MLKRVLFGLLKGSVVGGLLGAAVVFGLGMPVFAAWLAYVAAALTGALTGLVAGRAIWEKDARIEAGLKAGVGAVIATLAMFAVRKWLNVSLNLGQLGHGAVGQLPLASLPLISTVLALFYELDNTGDSGAPETPAKKVRVEAEGADAVASTDDLQAALEADDEEAARKATKH
ncbi:MAG: hypothetical protein IPI67_13935 [Myxococcales bacterium]|nr:hypothetical protein [Myxococcales bacterium]